MEHTPDRKFWPADVNGQERRSAPRLIGCFPVQVVELWEHVDSSGVTRDVSRTGGFLFTRTRLQTGDPVKVRIFMSGDFTRPTVAYGRVVRSANHASPNSFWKFGAALQFDRPIDLRTSTAP